MRVSSNIIGTKQRPRISVYRSNRYIYVQAIDDVKRVTLASATDWIKTKDNKKQKGKKTDEAKKTGMMLAKALITKKINTGVFDRGSYAYLGRVKSLAEGLREAGLKI